MNTYKTADLSGAEWISTGGACCTPMIRKTLSFPKVTSAKITIAGLGIFEIFINGKKVSDDLFLPLSTDFHERPEKLYRGVPYDEKMRHRLYCPVYDITSYLKEGENTIAFLMGPGWYEMPNECYEYGHIKLCYVIDWQDEKGETHRTGSDGSHKWKESYVKKANLLKGEVHDYRDYDETWMQTPYDDSDWAAVCLEKAPETHFYIQDCPADRVIRHITPRLLAEKGDVRIYDAGEIITGYPVLVSDALAGEEITVLHGELLNKKGRLTKENTYKQKTVFYTDGTERSMHCRFTWFGFQYFEVKGNAKVTDCVVIHSDVKVSSTFSSSDETLNWLREAYLRTQLDNMHCGIPSDCPHVERRGYTGDGQLTCNAAMIQLDGEKFYRKWIQDIADCQDSITGHVQYTAPYIPSGGGPGGWGCAIVMVPYVFYRNYGDQEILKELYPQMLHYFDYLEAHSEKDLVVSDRAGEWCLGDWCVPTMGFVNNMDAIYIPAPLVNTYFYIKSMEKVLEIGEIIGNHQADEELKEKIRRKKQAILDEYFDPATGDFAENQQGSNVFAVDLGIGDERTFANILKHYRKIRKYDTGIFATDVLTRILFERGESELAISLLTSKEEDTFYSRMKKGGTTIPEYWTGHRSQCHPMFGAVSQYLFEYVLGIRQKESSVCYEDIVIAPECMDTIEAAEGSIMTKNGRISVKYDKTRLEVQVPEKTKALVRLNGKEKAKGDGEKWLRIEH